MQDVLLVNLPSAFGTYKGTKVDVYVQVYPVLSLACLAAVLRQKSFSVSILDLGIEKKEPFLVLDRTLDKLKPRIVGVTCTTPLYFEAAEISRAVKKRMGKEVITVIGGPHASALPEECLKTSTFDIVVVGEGDNTIVEIAEGRSLSDIKGIYYKEGEKILSTPPRPFIKDLDSLPFPALDLFDIPRYRSSKLVSRKTPMIDFMTSRGCAFNCSFCGKGVFGRRFRAKSPERVIEEIKYMLGLGFQEIRFVDDMFTTDMEHAKTVCQMILKEGLHFPWNLAAGLRVNCVDEEFLSLAKRAGLYQVSVGFESGDQACLDSIDKGITVEQGLKAMEMIRKAGLECVGFFMLGLPAETEESMKKTIDFAVKLMPDFAKVTITMPLPDARLFREYEEKGLIKSRDWSQYKLHGAGDVYQHPTLSHEKLEEYYELFYRRFYLNPKYLFRRAKISLSRGTFFLELYYGLRIFFPRLFG
ncbi:B12-binding domain-containing radical SAM protein [Chloroflexota bacterium]